MLSDDRRHEIGTFLRLRRERLQPEQVGLPRGRRRRTPGLRREEVAALAGLSTEWYTWLEQARDVQASAETLRRIAAALRLEPGETRHLLTLAGYGAESPPALGQTQPNGASARLQNLLERFENCPAWVHGERWDFLAWNAAASVIHTDLATAAGLERNAVYRAFMKPELRRMLLDWEKHARDIVAKVRIAHARNVDDPWFNELIETLRTESAEFSRWWNEHNVQLPQGVTKRYRHPGAGLLTFDVNMFDVVGEPFTANLVAYVPADAATEQRMRALCSARKDLSPVRNTIHAAS